MIFIIFFFCCQEGLIFSIYLYLLLVYMYSFLLYFKKFYQFFKPFFGCLESPEEYPDEDEPFDDTAMFRVTIKQQKRSLNKENRIYIEGNLLEKSVNRPFCCTVSILQVYFTYLCYITFWALEYYFIENLKLILKKNQIMKQAGFIIDQ